MIILPFSLWGELMIEKMYIVVSVESFLDGVMMFLKPSDLIMPPRMEPAISSESEDVKVARNIAQTMIQELKRDLPGPPSSAKFSVFTIGIYLNLAEYEQLGKPTVNDTIRMQLEVRKED